jgi:hypothetical protein
MLKPGRYNGLVVYQGATFDVTFTWRQPVVSPATVGTPVDLSGYTARMQIRQSVASTDTLLELTTEDGGITLGGTDGTITLAIDAADTAAVTWTSGVWDLEMVIGDSVTRLLYGRIKVSKEVTR